MSSYDENAKYCVKYSEKEINLLKEMETFQKKTNVEKMQMETGHLPVPLKKLLQIKSRINIFNNIEHKSLISIITDVQFEKFAKGDVIVQEGSKCSDMFFILMGECQIVVNKTAVGYLRGGHVFGEIAAVFQTARTASVISSKNNTTTLSFKLNHEASKKYPFAFMELYKNVAKELSMKLEAKNRGE